jgi:hypothetical protein
MDDEKEYVAKIYCLLGRRENAKWAPMAILYIATTAANVTERV